MVDLSMYPMKGNCRFPNIFEQLATGRIERVTLPAGPYYIGNWGIGINIKYIDGEMYLIPFISYESEYYSKCRMGYYLGIRKSKYCTTKTVLPTEWHAQGLSLKFLDLKLELLDDGALVVEYGVQVEGLQDVNNIWNFQLRSDLFDSKGKQVMIPFRENETDRCHRQIKAIHLDKSIEIKHGYIDFYNPSQIAHGVRLQQFDLYWTNRDAHAMGLRNVVHYCQWQMIQQQFTWPDYQSYELRKFQCVIDCEMRSLLVHLIREMNSKEKLMKVLEEVDIDMMSGESMKTFMKFLIYD